MEIVEDGAVAVGLGEIAVIRPGADGAAVAQMVVAGDEDAPGGQIDVYKRQDYSLNSCMGA